MNAEVLKNILELLCSKNEEICSLKLQEQIRANIEVYEEFLNAILKPDLTKALSLSNEFIKSDADIKIFFESVILPSLYSVGNKWENCEISVSQEHTATSICQKIMSEYYPRIIKYINKKQKVLVTMSPGEFHQVGGRMLADIIELEGYDVIFLNSDSSSKEKLNAIELENIDYVVISTTLVSNIEKTHNLVKEIKNKFKEKSPKIIIGGQAFFTNNVSKFIEADYLLRNTDELLDILRKSEND